MKKLFLVASVAAIFASCAAVQSPVVGMAYTDVKAPMAVTSNSGSSKVGTAYAESYVGLVALGDASLAAAKKAAGISRVSHVDYQSMTILGLYSKFTTVVYGE